MHRSPRCSYPSGHPTSHLTKLKSRVLSTASMYPGSKISLRISYTLVDGPREAFVQHNPLRDIAYYNDKLFFN